MGVPLQHEVHGREKGEANTAHAHGHARIKSLGPGGVPVKQAVADALCRGVHPGGRHQQAEDRLRNKRHVTTATPPLPTRNVWAIPDTPRRPGDARHAGSARTIAAMSDAAQAMKESPSPHRAARVTQALQGNLCSSRLLHCMSSVRGEGVSVVAVGICLLSAIKRAPTNERLS